MLGNTNLNENQIIDALCQHLTTNGYQILNRCLTTQRGIDIIAKHSSTSVRLLVEAKGGTSAQRSSARYNRGFNPNQVFDRVAKGLYTAICLLSQYQSAGDKVALAFPDTDQFRLRLEAIRPALLELNILVYLVSADKNVREF
ncbi:MAG: hypothetical protein P4L33_02580 [Capsulimonadaceae bacterium]|nr:hypothetical protein [Capsulimonadaceae bacterium]